MGWIWWAVGGAFVLGGWVGMVLMAVLAAGARSESAESAKSADELGIGV